MASKEGSPRFIPKVETVEKYGGGALVVLGVLTLNAPAVLFGVLGYWDGNRRGKTPSK